MVKQEKVNLKLSIHSPGLIIKEIKKEGVLWFRIWGARLESTGKFDFLDHLNEWHHTVVTFKGKSKETKIYVDENGD